MFFPLAGLLLRAKRHLRPRFARMTTWSGTQWTKHTKTCPQEINHCWCGSNFGKMHQNMAKTDGSSAPNMDDGSGAKFSTHPQVHFMSCWIFQLSGCVAWAFCLLMGLLQSCGFPPPGWVDGNGVWCGKWSNSPLCSWWGMAKYGYCNVPVISSVILLTLWWCGKGLGPCWTPNRLTFLCGNW